VQTLVLARPPFAARPATRPVTGPVVGETHAVTAPPADAPVAGPAGGPAVADRAWAAGGRGDAAPADLAASRAAAGDPEALRWLVETYHPRCLRFARNMGLAAEDAEEAVQDAFVRMAGALPRFRPGAAFEPWLFRILGNRCRSARVRARRWAARAVDATALDTMPAPDADALATLDRAQRRDTVLRALDALPAEQREAFLLRHVEDMDYAAMARATGAGQSALKMRVKRACDALRARLGGAAGGPVAGAAATPDRWEEQG
jgi:RNA polymerase sigma-70 factor (ECF subfamily)